jgi:hypothetical protein
LAIDAAYATPQEYRQSIDQQAAGDDLAITRDLLAVSRYLDRALGQESGFNQDASAVVRSYYGDGSRLLRVDNIATTSGLSIKIDEDNDGSFADESALASTDYQLRRNGDLNPDKGPQPRPWNEIYLTHWGTKGSWPLNQLVQLTAIFGWPVVPEAIKAACIELTAILRVQSPRATRTVNELQQVLGTSRRGQDILDDLINAYGAAVVA